MEYQIVRFIEETGQLIVRVDGFADFALDVPIVDGNYITGEALERFINGFMPVSQVERRKKISGGIPNASALKELVVPVAEFSDAQGPSWEEVRVRRSLQLAHSDWTQLSDAPLTEEEKVAWAAYRQQLRDIPQSFSAPEDVVFPVEPR